MICHFSSYFLFVFTGCALALPRIFEIQLNELNGTIILSEIISNYIRRYFSHETDFISLVHASSSKENRLRFHEELTDNLLHNSKLANFSYNNINKLDARHHHLHAFNIILIHDTHSLRQVYLTLNH